ncbi:DUF5996 family protein [Algoriphagus halophytocola]|uniref:DUF5996 family protein n=1 Tax=Algoriphagus halophytocola TaxID=2991499 RepID=A0ABY6MLC5_9BACT|nr:MULTISPECIES: DUF5996 family protein [unclassified Algoriphagus]UZD23774.1 DUF5996 family protein [Algoriphagus sp. TR-M5]WBL45068.1 DUF5996 family protein [Algoriphagus sp. TR-M9]
MATKKNSWPVLNFEESKDTIYLLHQWTQIVGKVRLKKSPWQNHSWHVSLYVDSQGLTTGLIPYENGVFDIKFDFIHHELKIKTSNGTRDRFALGGQTVASFYEQLMEKLKFLGIAVEIVTTPNEIPNPIPFPKNKKRLVYQANAAQSLWKALVQIQTVFRVFEAKFTGKSSPIHFFWGSFDLAYTRFSGRKAPVFTAEVPNIPLAVMQEAYSHEVFSVGFWPGSEQSPEAVFYAYCYPNHPEFQAQPVLPEKAFWQQDMGEFMLPYEVVQKSSKPQEILLQFLDSTYSAASKVGDWDRENLDCDFTQFEQ